MLYEVQFKITERCCLWVDATSHHEAEKQVEEMLDADYGNLDFHLLESGFDIISSIKVVYK